jgi:hypothetical protein
MKWTMDGLVKKKWGKNERMQAEGISTAKFLNPNNEISNI